MYIYIDIHINIYTYIDIELLQIPKNPRPSNHISQETCLAHKRLTNISTVAYIYT